MLTLLQESGVLDVFTEHLVRNGLVFLVLAGMVTVVFVLLYLRAAPRPVHHPPRHLSAPPADLAPALVSMLFDPAPTPDKMAATLLDLVRRGVVTMDRLDRRTHGDFAGWEGERSFVLRRDRLGKLQPFERELVGQIFDEIAGADQITSAQIRDWWHQHPATGGVLQMIWSVKLKQAMVARELIDPGALKLKRQLTRYGVLVMLGAVLTPLLLPWPLLFVSLGMTFVLVAQRLSGASQRGVELQVQYEAFRRYLAECGRFGDQPAEAVAIWDQYMPLAIALGVGDRAQDEVRPGPAFYDRWGAVCAGFFPDEAEARAYLDERRRAEPDLPAMNVTSGDNPRLIFDSSVESPMTVTTLWSKWTLSPRQRPWAAVLAVSPFLVLPSIGVLAYLAVAAAVS